MKTINLSISGMTCNHCASTIEATLAKVAGVNKASVSYADKLAQVTIIPEANLNVETLINAVQESGYGAELNSGELFKLDKDALHDTQSTASPTKEESDKTPLKIIIIGSGSAAFAAAKS